MSKASAYKKIQVVGVSSVSASDAISAAVQKASETIHGLSWFEVEEVRGRIEEGKVSEYQASVVIGFKID